jgi:hypothetical protein
MFLKAAPENDLSDAPVAEEVSIGASTLGGDAYAMGTGGGAAV